MCRCSTINDELGPLTTDVIPNRGIAAANWYEPYSTPAPTVGNVINSIEIFTGIVCDRQAQCPILVTIQQSFNTFSDLHFDEKLADDEPEHLCSNYNKKKRRSKRGIALPPISCLDEVRLISYIGR